MLEDKIALQTQSLGELHEEHEGMVNPSRGAVASLIIATATVLVSVVAVSAGAYAAAEGW
ncbi:MULTISPECIES: hypothetical protein [unclassified Streptomyces]|uniref:hypothetical protein n=1 Tax=unclassified Streptomyces TaxID=2593676 RepID=UPI001F03CFC5|nr:MULTISPECIES: hypothetical protein [unclassified Streptomyces]MCH0566468.1 hypothetical protein [Streptomyces sp. MUM 2J]MCH0571886.1 hypothetical protein [Streptomyces sp. MUM 136J]